ncbi:hypothetical protein BaRGS_00036254, partial [Batillaria attramentaria]
AAVGADLVMFTENAKTGWNQASQQCQTEGMTLATLDETTNNYLKSLMGYSWYQNYGKIEFWIGLYDSDPSDTSSSGGYQWAADCAPLHSGGLGVASGWAGWGSGEPQNTGDSFCVALTKDTAEWRTFKCDSLFQFLCQRTRSEILSESFQTDA